MDYITTTNLRTKSTQLVDALKKGKSVSLIHRSQIIGEIQPVQEAQPLTKESIEKLKKLAKELNLPKLSYKERDKLYRKRLEEKYGKDLS